MASAFARAPPRFTGSALQVLLPRAPYRSNRNPGITVGR
jgi:hypothetical protein